MKNKNAKAMGKLGGMARSAKLTPERRKEIARSAATARWLKAKLKKNESDKESA